MEKKHLILTWAARVVGFLFFSLFAFYMYRGRSIWDSTAEETGSLLLYILTALSFFGYIWTWFKMRFGALLILGTGIVLGAVFLMSGDLFPMVTVALPLMVTGLCFLAAAQGWLV